MILTLLTSILWVSLSIYRALTVRPSESVPKEISNPITPTLNQEMIKKIESGIFFDSSQIPENVTAPSSPVPSQSEQPLSTPIPEATPTASPSATPQQL